MNRCVGLLCGVLAGAEVAHAQAAPPQARLFFQPPVLSDVQLAPDGRRVAMRLRAEGGRDRLAVLDLASMQPTVVADFKDVDVGAVHWVNATRLVFDSQPPLTGPNQADAGPGLFAVNADGSGFRQLVESGLVWVKAPEAGVPLLHWANRLLATLPARGAADVWVVRPDEISKDRIGFFNLQRLDTATGRATDVDAQPGAEAWLLDGEGRLRLLQTRQGDKLALHWREADGPWRQLAQGNLVDAPWAPLCMAPDGTVLVTAAHQGFDAVFRLDTSTGKPMLPPLAAVRGFDLQPQCLVGRGTLLGLRYTVDAEITQWLDADAKALQTTVDALLPATANRIQLPQTGDAAFVLVQAFADVQPMLSYLYHRETRKLTRLGVSHPGIDPRQMGLTDFVRYAAADGREIPAYVTLPPGRTVGDGKQALPLVVLVHGGPWARGARWEWQAEVQFLATRGYAVLQPEFRGSTGFGAAHFRAGWREWGGAMQTDLADGARWAVAKGIADPARMAIAGGSYGGYAALMGLLQQPDLFRAGINWVGVTDPLLLFSVGWSDTTNEFKRYSMARLVGDPQADAARLNAVSPLAQAARIKRPLLMAYGAWDVRVPLVHGEAFRDANRPHNPDLEWVLYPDEGHGWRKPETQLDFWGRVERFLARHLAPP